MVQGSLGIPHVCVSAGAPHFNTSHGRESGEEEICPRKHVLDVVGWSQLMERCSRISSFLGAITNIEIHVYATQQPMTPRRNGNLLEIPITHFGAQ
jgi:hypothetical protein